MEKTKVCNKCREEKELTTEFFARERRNPDGYNYKCKKCVSEYKKIFRKNNRNKISKENKRYYEDNKEAFAKRKEGYYEANKKRLDEYNRSYHQENKELINMKAREYRRNNKFKISEYHKVYVQENKDKFRKYNQRRRALKLKLPNTLTNEEWLTILSEFDNKCAYCGINQSDHLKLNNENLHQEHLVPLSKGGGYTHNNIIPACRSCNSSKGNSDFFDWYPKNKHYDEERNEFILNFLGYTDKNRQQLSIF